MSDTDSLYEVMTAGEAVKIFGLSRGAVRKAIKEGRIKGRLSGGTWLVRTKDAWALWGYLKALKAAE